MAAASAILAIERAALDRWGKGDPGGYLEASAADVTYFDPFTERRVDGLKALGAWYASFRGKIKIDNDQIVDPYVQRAGEIAVLTFQYIGKGSDGAMRWNCTEVYRQSGETWKIIHTHWSLAHDPAKDAG
ncbi:MAG: DUF4440 domain-containing protein [Rhodospirillaceae bacterium]|nr:DUF4440 domain-containing protein [Rhodospirillaceae bacterium]